LRDLLLKFWDSSISRECLKLETLNLAGRLTTKRTLRRCLYGPQSRLYG